MTHIKVNYEKADQRTLTGMAVGHDSAARKELVKRALKGDKGSRMVVAALGKKQK